MTELLKWVRFRRKFLKELVDWDGRYTCRGCYKPIERPDLHHIEKRSTHPHLKYDPFNIVLLCRECHQKRHE